VGEKKGKKTKQKRKEEIIFKKKESFKFTALL